MADAPTRPFELSCWKFGYPSMPSSRSLPRVMLPSCHDSILISNMHRCNVLILLLSPAACYGFTASHNNKIRKVACCVKSVKSKTLLLSLSSRDRQPLDADGTPRSPMMDAFRPRRFREWSGSANTFDGNTDELSTADRIIQLRSWTYLILGVATVVAWSACAIKALTYHPDPALETICGFRHNCLTIGQALSFPVPLTISVFVALSKTNLTLAISRRLNLGFAFCSLWMGASVAYMPAFACGYQLYGSMLKAIASSIHFVTAGFCLSRWARDVKGGTSTLLKRMIQGLVGSVMCLFPKNASDDPSTVEGSDGRNEYSFCAVLFLWFSILPIISAFPLATVPSILGRRLSRAASGWTFLATVVSYVIKDGVERRAFDNRLSDDAVALRALSRGLAFGSALHLFIIALKLIGVDGGGLILSGNGLWEVYPMALAVPFSAAASCVMHFVAISAATVLQRKGKMSTTKEASNEPPIGAFE